MKVHLVDGTYELFRSYFGAPPKTTTDGRQVGATLGLLNSLLALLTRSGATHVACAFDHVIESFRNDLFTGYKTGEGIPTDLMSQFPLAEEAAAALGIVVWPMVEFEADDALASAAVRAAADSRVHRVLVCTPDKDLAQSVRGTRIVQMDRRARSIRDEAGIIAKFGVPPTSIPDYLALVGDASDGYPGLKGWGAKSTAAVLAKYGHIESIPADWRTWGVNATRPAALAATLEQERDRAFLFRDLATLRTDVPVFDNVDRLRWDGPTPAFAPLAARLDAAREHAGTARDALADVRHQLVKQPRAFALEFDLWIALCVTAQADAVPQHRSCRLMGGGVGLEHHQPGRHHPEHRLFKIAAHERDTPQQIPQREDAQRDARFGVGDDDRTDVLARHRLQRRPAALTPAQPLVRLLKKLEPIGNRLNSKS